MSAGELLLDVVFSFRGCLVLAFLILVGVGLLAGASTRQNRRWARVIDGHHARTGRYPTVEDLTRPARRRSARAAVVPVVAVDEPQWWLLDCPACGAYADVAGTEEEIDRAVDWHNRTRHHSASATRYGRPGDGVNRAA